MGEGVTGLVGLDEYSDWMVLTLHETTHGQNRRLKFREYMMVLERFKISSFCIKLLQFLGLLFQVHGYTYKFFCQFNKGQQLLSCLLHRVTKLLQNGVYSIKKEFALRVPKSKFFKG